MKLDKNLLIAVTIAFILTVTAFTSVKLFLALLMFGVITILGYALSAWFEVMKEIVHDE